MEISVPVLAFTVVSEITVISLSVPFFLHFQENALKYEP